MNPIGFRILPKLLEALRFSTVLYYLRIHPEFRTFLYVAPCTFSLVKQAHRDLGLKPLQRKLG